ncbi:toprim domain-containing protein [bacterium]|nr:toprim domain-containing protein [bacterium]
MDVIALYKAKINNVVGTMGVSLSEHHIEMFKKSKNIKHVILGFDNDEAGKTATITAGEHLLKKGLNVFVVDQTNNDCKDFDEYVNKHNEDALDLLLKKQIHFSIFYLNQIINKYNLETISDQELFLINALEIIKKYGNILYKEQYIIFLTQQINYPASVLSEKIHHALENQESYVSKEQSYEQPSNENFARSLKTFKNTTIKILQAFFKDRLSIQIFKDEYTLLGKVNNFDEFNEIYDLLYRSFYFLQDFYDQYQQFSSITNENSFSILTDYINTKIDKKYQAKFKKLFQEVYKSNESIYFTYEFTRKNFHSIIISCLESDLETRKIFLLNKIKDDYQKTGI